MSCDGNDSFGYVKIEDDMVVAYTGESNNPTVHKFCNEEFVQAVKLLQIIKKRIKEVTNILDSHEDIDWALDGSLGALDKALGIYKSLLEESKK